MSRTEVIWLLVVLFAAVNTYYEVRTRGWGYAGKNWLIAWMLAIELVNRQDIKSPYYELAVVVLIAATSLLLVRVLLYPAGAAGSGWLRNCETRTRSTRASPTGSVPCRLPLKTPARSITSRSGGAAEPSESMRHCGTWNSSTPN